MEKLVLFDIDGTLVKSIPGNPHAKAFTQSINNLYNIQTELDWAEVAGLTDRLIFRQILEGIGWQPQKVTDEMPALLKELEFVYVKGFKHGSVEKMPGVDSMLSKLTLLGVQLGLLTGNLYEIAKTKLTDAGIFDYFDVGGYGSDEHSQRNELVTIATQRANKQDGLDKVYLVGDTPRDITAAREAGVFHAIGYAASHHGEDELKNAQAESVIESFENWSEVKKSLGLL